MTFDLPDFETPLTIEPTTIDAMSAIAVASRPDAGSIFTVLLPCERLAP